MANGYLVKKRIRGRLYLYRQWSWREGGKVKTKTRCLGPLGEGDGKNSGQGLGVDHENQGSVDEDAMVLAAQGAAAELTEAQLDAQLAINPFANEAAQKGRRPAAIDWERLFRQTDYTLENGSYPIRVTGVTEGAADGEVKSLATKATKRRPAKSQPQSKPKRKRAPKDRRPEGFVGLFFRQNLGSYGVSEQALAREYEALCLQFEQLDLDWEAIPSILIREGRRPRWRQSWFNSGAYVVTLPKTGGRNRFKRAYREVLADCLIRSMKKDRPDVYRQLMAGQSQWKRGGDVFARDTLAEIMQRGSKGARQVFTKQARRTSKTATDIRKRGEVGKAVLAALKDQGCVW